MAKQILIICYYWPPAGGPGVQRWLFFVKHLVEMGYRPTVFIPENANYPIVDEALAQHIPKEVTIIKRPILEPYEWASLLSRKQSKDISAGIVPSKQKQTIIQKLLLFVRGNFFIPDARVLWVKPAAAYLKSYLSTTKIDTIITTGPPHSIHLIGKKLQSDLPIRWIADFRDPWTTIGYHDALRMTKRTKAKHKKLERAVLRQADALIVTSPTTQNDFEKITSQPVHLITNGYGSSERLSQYDASQFILTHIGSLLSNRNPSILWEALSEICDEISSFENELIIQLAGKVSEEVLATIHKCGLSRQLRLEGYVSHKQAVTLQQQASALLLLEVDDRITKAIIPGKLFEYLAARRPIIAIGPVGWDAINIINECSAGKVFNYTDKMELKSHILHLYRLFKKDNLNDLNSDITPYSRKELTKKLISIIEKK